MSSSEEGSRAIFVAFLANLAIALAKFVGFLFTNSASMLAESMHSLADTGNQALLLFGRRRARRPASPQHPFGYGRERYFWAFIVALVLFSLGALFAIWRRPRAEVLRVLEVVREPAQPECGNGARDHDDGAQQQSYVHGFPPQLSMFE